MIKIRKYKLNKLVKNFMQGNILAIILFFSVAAMTYSALSLSAEKNSDEQIRLARESVTRAVVTCYAIEGRYPESFEYIKENYGTGINEEKFVVYYDIFAENIMPEITIIER